MTEPIDPQMIHQIDYKNDLECPKCYKKKMHYLKGRYGWFWSCSKYPRCNGTLSIKQAEIQIEKLLGVQEISDMDYANGGDYDPGGDYD